MQIDTRACPFALTNPAANSTAATFSTLVPSINPPSVPGTITDGVNEFGVGGGGTANAILLVPFGVGANGNTFAMKVYGWRATTGRASQYPLWVPVLLASYSNCTLDSTLPGVAGADVGTNQYFCSAISLVVGNSGISEELLSAGAAAHEIAHCVVDVKGFAFTQVIFSTGSVATSCNALYAKM